MKQEPTLQLPTLSDTGGIEPESMLNVFLIYDDSLTGSEARSLLDSAVMPRLDGFETHVDEMSCAELGNPRIFIEAAEMAQTTHLLVIATKDAAHLCPCAEAWLSELIKPLAATDGAVALLELGVGGMEVEAPAMLQNLTVAHGVPFFFKAIKVEPAPLKAYWATRWHQAEQHYLPRPEGWGINE